MRQVSGTYSLNPFLNLTYIKGAATEATAPLKETLFCNRDSTADVHSDAKITGRFVLELQVIELVWIKIVKLHAGAICWRLKCDRLRITRLRPRAALRRAFKVVFD